MEDYSTKLNTVHETTKFAKPVRIYPVVRETLIIDLLQAVRNDVARPLAVTERGRTDRKDYDWANLTESARPDPGTVGPSTTSGRSWSTWSK